MTCSFCAIDFDAAAARTGCASCALAGGGCRSIRCPRCGYEMPEEPALLARLRAWISRRAPARPRAATDTLAAMAPGERGTVVKLDVGDPAHARKLMALGVVPGAPVEIERTHPAVVFRTGYTQLAIDESLARSVVVDLRAAG